MAFTPEDRAKGLLVALARSKKTKYMRNAVFDVAFLPPEEIEAYKPKTGIEMIVKTMVLKHDRKEGQLATTVLKTITETIGERVGSNWKETREHNEGKPDIIADLPMAKRDPDQMN